MPAEAYTLSTMLAATKHITNVARKGGDPWEKLWASVDSEYSAYHVCGVFGQDEWLVAFACGKRVGLSAEAFDLLEVVCEMIVRKAGLFTRTHVGVI